MKKLEKGELIQALRAAGIARGDVVHVQSDLLRIGPVNCGPGREAPLCFYLEAFQELLGTEGTLTTCTAFEDYGRYGTPFVREESPSRLGAFSEYIRTRPGAVRSMHPIVSVTAVGRRATELCGGHHFDGFGYASPWGRLHQLNAWILTLGMDSMGGGTTFFHYVEKLYGVPYQYTKLFPYEVYSNGRLVEGPFTMSVRYLDYGIVNTPVRVKKRMVDLGEAKEVRTGYVSSWCARTHAIVARMMQMFDENRWVMLQEPPKFRPGEIPMDGVTGDMRVYYDKSAAGRHDEPLPPG
ncbi:MAG TPA: AAC(3) family N-acetyltransferase [Nitrospiraceae bacterium]|nr:AAC(3) family N-acetyltransferase [Nitrospiraceae bacterium]